jgi:hypothetical protein
MTSILTTFLSPILNYLPPFPSLPSASFIADILPLAPLVLSSNAFSIALEWANHLHPLVLLKHPIAPATLSEIFRNSYLNGASSFLFSLLGSILSSAYLAYSLPYPYTSMNFSHVGPNNITALTHLKRVVDPSFGTVHDPHHALRYWYLATSIFGILHLLPFSALIVRFVDRACDGKGRIKDTDEVKKALKSWLRINWWRMGMDAAAVGCALLAVLERARLSKEGLM